MQATNTTAQAPKLTIHSNPKPEGLLQIRAMFGEAKHMPEYVYQHALSDKQRMMLCFAAGLNRIDIGKPWAEFTADQRQSIRKGLMMLNNIVTEFIDHNALEPYKFIEGAKPNEPKYSEGSVVRSIGALTQPN
jgi:hypothetical protein